MNFLYLGTATLIAIIAFCLYINAKDKTQLSLSPDGKKYKYTFTYEREGNKNQFYLYSNIATHDINSLVASFKNKKSNSLVFKYPQKIINVPLDNNEINFNLAK